jgi:transcription elongation factor Elf1
MKLLFLDEGKFTCPFCGREKHEIWSLDPTTDEEYAALEEKLGDVANWVVCEACLWGCCEQPNEWFENIFPKLQIKAKN